MAEYLASRIIEGAYTYNFVLSRRPEFKERIDAYLIKQGREDLITKTDEEAEENK